MGIEKSIWFLVLTLIAEIIGTIGGFGSSVFFVPFANIFLIFIPFWESLLFFTYRVIFQKSICLEKD
ncbi:hypothetical protein [Flavobacterium piscinae]|uniref:hypothetical protein n=1 Tax=Flavobacterium piscinae TaxID=2506424 RepID=UPI002AABC05F|nr:hypothetical protein [Flavobacterium piscinae]